MKNIRGIALAVVTLFGSTFGAAPPVGITLIGKGLVSGSALDKSGLTGVICQAGNPANCVPKALFGGFGSALTYTGHNNVYIAVPDRGPFDGLTDVPYLDRIHFLKITTNLGASFPNINVTLLDTRLLSNERGDVFVGAAGSFDIDATGSSKRRGEPAPLRFDPEGIRIGFPGSLFISDEYGPYIYEFDVFGLLSGRID